MNETPWGNRPLPLIENMKKNRKSGTIPNHETNEAGRNEGSRLVRDDDKRRSSPEPEPGQPQTLDLDGIVDGVAETTAVIKLAFATRPENLHFQLIR